MSDRLDLLASGGSEASGASGRGGKGIGEGPFDLGVPSDDELGNSVAGEYAVRFITQIY